jgi:hypothetical protein
MTLFQRRHLASFNQQTRRFFHLTETLRAHLLAATNHASHIQNLSKSKIRDPGVSIIKFIDFTESIRKVMIKKL